MQLRRLPAPEAGKVIQQVEAAQITVEFQLAGEIAQAAMRGRCRGCIAQQPNLAVIGKHQAEHNAQGRRFACTVGAEKAKAFASLHGKAHFVQRGDIAQTFEEAVDL